LAPNIIVLAFFLSQYCFAFLFR